MVYVSPSTPYIKLLKPFLLKKYRLATDAWGADDKAVRHVYAPLVTHLMEEIPDGPNRKLYPPIWSLEDRVTRISRTMLVAEFLVMEWAETFRGMDEARLDELAKSFLFENCEKREGLNRVLTQNVAA